MLLSCVSLPLTELSALLVQGQGPLTSMSPKGLAEGLHSILQ